MPLTEAALGLCAAVSVHGAVVGVGKGSATEIVAPSPLEVARIDNALEVDGSPIAARNVRSRLSLPVMINGAGPYPFVVDSAADRTVVGRRLASGLGLPGRPCVRVHSIAGAALVDAVAVDRLQVARTVIEDGTSPVLPDAALGSAGLLGIDMLAGQRLKLDFVAPSATIEDARRVEASLAGDVVVVARPQHGQLILAEASAGSTQILAVIDTGAEVSIGNGALRARLLGGRHPLGSRMVQLTSVTGEPVNAELATIPEIEIGGITIRTVPVAFVDAPPFAVFGLEQAPALLLGTDVLRSFRRVTLDFRRRRIRFSLRPAG